MTAAVVLALCIHACMAGMILYEVDWDTPESSPAHVLDLRPLSVDVVMQRGHTGKTPDSAFSSSLVPVKMVEDEAYVGSGQGNQNDVLRLVRSQINAAWQPIEPRGLGKAVVVLTIARQGRITSAQVTRIQGDDSFGTFMKTFLADLGALELSVPDAGREFQVECEFSVGE